MSTLNFTVDREKCISCDACVKDCPAQIIKNQEDRVPAIPSDLEADCLKCQHCLAVCPTAAISIFGVDPEQCPVLDVKSLPEPDALALLLRGRRSVRQFLPQNVDPALIGELLATVANSPTGCNDMSLRFTVVDDRAVMQQLLRCIVERLDVEMKAGRLAKDSFLAEAVVEYQSKNTDAFFRGAPHALLVSAGPTATCPAEDVNIALSYFELLAQSYGLGTLWCGMLKFALDAAPALKKMLKLDGEQYYYAVLFGLPAVHYARAVKRDDAATICKVTADDLV